MNLQTPRILWGSLLTSNALYAGVLVYLNASSPARSALTPQASLAPAFALVALGLAAASVLLPRALYAGAARALAPETRDDVKDDPLGATQGFRRPAVTIRDSSSI